ncbi:hypothetical protein Hanom_Chr10g00880831 [Helianthus anomalus]
MILSSEESVDSSRHRLTPPHHASCASGLRNLGIGPDGGMVEKTSRKKSMNATGLSKKKKTERAVVATDAGSKKGTTCARKASSDDYDIVSATLSWLDFAGGKGSKKTKSGVGARSALT